MTTSNVVRLGDPGTSSHASCLAPVDITSASANERNVYANGILISTETDVSSDHGPHGGPPCIPGPSIYESIAVSRSVFIGGQGVARINDPYDCGAFIQIGSPNVFAGSDADTPTVANIALNNGDEIAAAPDVTPPGEPTPAEVYIQEQIAAGNVKAEEVAEAANVIPKAVDETPPKETPIITEDCSDISALFSGPNPPTGDAIDDVVLTNGWNVRKVTRKPNVVFDHALRGPSAGLEVPEIICNLKMLTINCIIPIFNQYQGGFLTNTWRPAGIGSSTSQHPKGQACDMQFKGISKSEYFNIAQWIKDNITFDQLLLEYKTTGSKLPWIHISYNKAGNRKQILTFMNNIKYGTGLIQLA